MYKIIKDEFNHDVLLTSDKRIPLNKSNSSLDYQRVVLKYCTEDINYSALEVNTNLYIIKEQIPLDNYDEYTIKVIDNQLVDLYSGIEDQSRKPSISFNNRYIVAWESDYECPIVEVTAAYDILNNKLIDCSDRNITNELIESVVKERRCMYDVVASILTNQILMVDYQRLLSFMSFVTNSYVNNENFQEYAPIVKKYIISCYPKIQEHNVVTDRRELINMNEIYGIDYFKFKQIPYEIQNIKYIKNNQKIKLHYN